MRCPHCGSRMIVPAADHKNFSVGKAVAGAVVAGPIGAAAGFIGKDIQGYRCNTCGAFSKTPMNAVDESLINTAVERAKNSGDRVSYERLCSQYPGIEQIASAPKAAVGSDRSLEVETYEEDGWEEVSGPSVKRAYAPNKLVKGCPVLVEKVIIQKGTSEDLLSMVVCNISSKSLRSVYFKVTVFDDVGDQITECSCVYQGLTAAPGVRLPEEKVFNLKTDVAYKLAIVCEKAAFTDDSVWRQSEEPVEYDLQEMLELTPGNFKEYKYLRILLSQNTHVDENTSIFRPVFAPEYRICVCGTPVTDHEKCPVCGLSEEELLAVIDYNALTECRRALIRENARKRADEIQAVLAQEREDTYNEAIRLKETKTRTGCEKAVQLFASLEDYKDAASQKALCEDKVKDYIYDEAITMTRKRVPCQEDYLAAIQEFKKISGWKDADEKVYACQEKIEEIKAKAEADRLEKERIAEIARKEVERIAKRNKKIAIIATPIVCAVIAFIIILNAVIIPNGKYNDAMALMDAGNLDEAYSIFSEIENYKDAADRAGDIRKERFKGIKVGNYIKFGAYEQDNNTSNGKEDIEWLVLEVKDGKALVISKYALDDKQYNTSLKDITWETCTLRKWLNNGFINAAFSGGEKAMISTVTVSGERIPSVNITYSTYSNATQDQVFLLSDVEAEKYFSSDSARQCEPTDYAAAKGASESVSGHCSWWLRSPGYGQQYAACVYTVGNINWYIGMVSSSYAVRPAMWINLNS